VYIPLPASSHVVPLAHTAESFFAGRLDVDPVNHPDFSPLLISSHANLPPLVVADLRIRHTTRRGIPLPEDPKEGGHQNEGYVYVLFHL